MIRFRKYELVSDKIKKNKTILNITDVHSDVDNLKDILSKLDKIKPDLITISGDLIDSINDKDNGELLLVAKEISDRYPTYVVLGNHDIVRIDKNKARREFKEIPFYLNLDSKSNAHIFQNNNEKYFLSDDICVIGFNLNQAWYKKYKEDRDMFNEMFKEYLKKIKIDKSKFNILLVHTPNALVNDGIIPSIDGIDLILCGHNHCGLTPEFIQKISKKNRGIVAPYNGFFPTYAYGYFTNKNTSLIISNGLTKISKTHGNKLVSGIINGILKKDAEIIELKKGKGHKLTLIDKVEQ